MPRLTATLRFLLQASAFGLAAAFLVALLRPDWADWLNRRAGDAGGGALPALDATRGRVSYADAVSRAAPSVVSIYTARVITEQPIQLVPNPTLQRFSGIPLGHRSTRPPR